MRLSERGHFASNWEEAGSIPTLTLRQDTFSALS